MGIGSGGVGLLPLHPPISSEASGVMTTGRWGSSGGCPLGGRGGGRRTGGRGGGCGGGMATSVDSAATSGSRSLASSLDDESSSLDEISRANRGESLRPSDDWIVSTEADVKLRTDA